MYWTLWFILITVYILSQDTDDDDDDSGKFIPVYNPTQS